MLIADISNWNERSYDPATDKDRIGAVFVKTSGNKFGHKYLNPDRAWQLGKVRAADLADGHYHFATNGATSWGSVEAQVDFFLDNSDIRPGGGIQWDWELPEGDGVAKMATVTETVTAMKRLNANLPHNWVWLYVNGLRWDALSTADKNRILDASPNTAPGGPLWKADYRPLAQNTCREPWSVRQITDGDRAKYPANTETWMTHHVDYNITKFLLSEHYLDWANSKGQPVAIAKPKTFKLSTEGWNRCSTNTKKKLVDIDRKLTELGFNLEQVYGYVGGTRTHVDGQTLDIMISDVPRGNKLRAWIWSLKGDDKWNLRYVVWQNTIWSETPGMGGDKGLPYTKDNSHRWHLHITWGDPDSYVSPWPVKPTVPRISIRILASHWNAGLTGKPTGHISTIQKGLIRLGYDLEPSGRVGPKTIAAMYAFCQKAALEYKRGDAPGELIVLALLSVLKLKFGGNPFTVVA